MKKKPLSDICPSEAFEALTELYAHLIGQGLPPDKAVQVVHDHAPGFLCEVGYTPTIEGMIDLVAVASAIAYIIAPDKWQAQAKAKVAAHGQWVSHMDGDGHISLSA